MTRRPCRITVALQPRPACHDAGRARCRQSRRDSGPTRGKCRLASEYRQSLRGRLLRGRWLEFRTQSEANDAGALTVAAHTLKGSLAGSLGGSGVGCCAGTREDGPGVTTPWSSRVVRNTGIGSCRGWKRIAEDRERTVSVAGLAASPHFRLPRFLTVFPRLENSMRSRPACLARKRAWSASRMTASASLELSRFRDSDTCRNGNPFVLRAHRRDRNRAADSLRDRCRAETSQRGKTTMNSSPPYRPMES